MRVLLLLYFLLYVGVAFALRSWLVWRRTGIDPVVLGRGEDAHAFIGQLLRIIVAAASSWRIGVDRDRRTELVSRGLFRLSRNPIFLGMMATLAGLFLVIPSAASLVVVVGVVVIQIQVRLEEEHLARIHGTAYLEYRQRVPRWLGLSRRP